MYSYSSQGCVWDKYVATGDEGQPSCGNSDKTNPCDVVTGRKTQRETDYHDGWLSFGRYYDSGSAEPGTAIGARWRHSFDTGMDNLGSRRSTGEPSWPQVPIPLSPLRSSDYNSRNDACTFGWQDIKAQHRGGALASASASIVSGVCELSLGANRVGVLSIQSKLGYLVPSGVPGAWGSVDSPIHTVATAEGSYYTFKEVSAGIYAEANGFPVRLELDGAEWLFYNTDNTVDRFGDGKLLTRTFIDGRVITMGYDAVTGRLTSITDDSGKALQLTYGGYGQVAELIHPDGVIKYSYTDYKLTTVTFEDNKIRQYHYEDTNFPHHLTGITDERGIRFATWAYDANGKAISSKHGDTLNANLTTLTHNGTSTTVTDAAGGTRIYNLGTASTFPVVTSITGDKCSDCPLNRMKTRTYDANGYLNEVTDWKGNITDYDYDNRGLQVQRIEAKGVPIFERTITTQWHPTLRLPVKITEPDRVIDFLYDTQGRLLERKVTPPPP